MWRLLVIAGGCRHLGGWEFQPGVTQSISGSQPFVTVHALEPPGSLDLMIECAPDGLQLSYRGRFSEAGAQVQFDDGPPLTLPVSLSLRGEPVVDLRASIDGETAEQRLIEASRVAVHPDGEPPTVFDVTHAERAIRRLRCP